MTTPNDNQALRAAFNAARIDIDGLSADLKRRLDEFDAGELTYADVATLEWLGGNMREALTNFSRTQE